MKKANMADMELGNIIFGHSRGEYWIEDREAFQEPFFEFLYEIGCDGHGCSKTRGEVETETDKYIIRPYYWGEDDDIAALPNFVYKPTGLEIRWYKYPMRDAYSNQDITAEQFKEILEDCRKDG